MALKGMFEEILQLNTIVQLMYSSEQYAAMKFAGRNFFNLNQNQNDSIIKDGNQDLESLAIHKPAHLDT